MVVPFFARKRAMFPIPHLPSAPHKAARQQPNTELCDVRPARPSVVNPCQCLTTDVTAMQADAVTVQLITRSFMCGQGQ